MRISLVPGSWPFQRRTDLPAEEQDLMAEHQDLGVLGRLRPGEQDDPAGNTKKNQAEQAYGHRSHPAGTQAPVPAKPHPWGPLLSRGVGFWPGGLRAVAGLG